MSEIRKDYLLDQWVIVVAERAKRPTDFSAALPKRNETKTCPFCPGNERMTPPALLLYRPFDGDIKKDRDSNGERSKDWLVRCVPNLYPALSPRKTIQLTEDAFHVRKDGVGSHEVIIESPNHNEHPSTARIEQLKLLVQAYLDRSEDLSKWEYVSIFRNHGRTAGASLSHPHSQIISTPIVPKRVFDELAACMAYFRRKKSCLLCKIIESEYEGPRFIYENKSFISFAPWASIHPFEFWLLPKRHQNTMLHMTKKEKGDLATALRVCMGSLARSLKDPPYSYGFHIAPNRGKHKYFHWHLEVYPKLTIHAGFENSTGIFINVTPPELAADCLRDSVKEVKKHL